MLPDPGGTVECDCVYCQHNAISRCDCDPCQYVRRNGWDAERSHPARFAIAAVIDNLGSHSTVAHGSTVRPTLVSKSGTVEQDERQQWVALRDADTLHLLPDEALIASIKYLAERLLELTEVGPS